MGGSTKRPSDPGQPKKNAVNLEKGFFSNRDRVTNRIPYVRKGFREREEGPTSLGLLVVGVVVSLAKQKKANYREERRRVETFS